MTTAVLFHHALGLTDGLLELTHHITRETGVPTARPDLFRASNAPSPTGIPTRFDTIEEGVAAAQAVGFDEIAFRGTAFCGALEEPLILIGWSLGVLPAVRTAHTGLDVAAVMLIDSAVSP